MNSYQTFVSGVECYRMTTRIVKCGSKVKVPFPWSTNSTSIGYRPPNLVQRAVNTLRLRFMNRRDHTIRIGLGNQRAELN